MQLLVKTKRKDEAKFLNAIGFRYFHLIPKFSDDPTHIIGYKLDAVSDPKIAFTHLDMNPDLYIKSITPQILDHGPILIKRQSEN